MIPDVLHLYWGRNRPLSYLRYLTVETFRRQNPGWEILVWQPQESCPTEPWDSGEHSGAAAEGEDWFPRLSELADLSRIVDWSNYSGMSEVHRSDLLRWRLLSERGGWWSDFDVLWLAPMPRVPEEAKAILFPYRDPRGRKIQSIGLLGGSGEVLWPDVHRWARRLAPSAIQYQALGREAVESVLRRARVWDGLVEMDPDTVYPFRTEQEWRLFWKMRRLRLRPSTIGIHWYAGHRDSGWWERELANRESVEKHKHLGLPRLILEATS